MKPIFVFPAALIGALILLVTMSQGVGTNPDSAVYISTARSVLAGDGFTALSFWGRREPLTHYPPLYPIVLAAISLIGGEPLEDAKWLNIVIFPVNIILVGLVLWASTGSVLSSLAGSLLALSSPDLLEAHSMAWSEPLFILLWLAGFYALSSHLKSGSYLALISSAILIGLAAITRYVGVACICAGTLVLFITNLKRPTNAIWFAAVSSFPVVIWTLRNVQQTGNVANRHILFHPLKSENIKEAAYTIVKWFGAFEFPTGIQCALLLLLITFMVVAGYASLRLEKYRLSVPFVLFIPVYSVLLIVSKSFVDSAIPFDGRILSPIFVATIVFVLSVCTNGARTRYARSLSIFVILTWIVLSSAQANAFIQEAKTYGLGYARKTVKNSVVLAHLKAIPATTKVYTNDPGRIYLCLGRETEMIPADPDTLMMLSKSMNPSRLIVIWFNGLQGRRSLPSEPKVIQTLSLVPVLKAADGTIYAKE